MVSEAEGPVSWQAGRPVRAQRDTGGDQVGPAHNGRPGLCPPTRRPLLEGSVEVFTTSASRAGGQVHVASGDVVSGGGSLGCSSQFLKPFAE